MLLLAYDLYQGSVSLFFFVETNCLDIEAYLLAERLYLVGSFTSMASSEMSQSQASVSLLLIRIRIAFCL
jgi:hypothetical protein